MAGVLEEAEIVGRAKSVEGAKSVGKGNIVKGVLVRISCFSPNSLVGYQWVHWIGQLV